MADRTDIDALLIGALYGELTPADEARLTAHLESHPADRTALSDLTQTRAAIRDRRLLAVQLEPPPSISALLLQEAARSRPSERSRSEERARESWFFRFTRSFMAHPAMAAAAMLVLVVGVAGTLYVRHGYRVAEMPADQSVAMSESAAPAAAPAPVATAAITPSGEASAPGSGASAPQVDQIAQRGPNGQVTAAGTAAPGDATTATTGFESSAKVARPEPSRADPPPQPPPPPPAAPPARPSSPKAAPTGSPGIEDSAGKGRGIELRRPELRPKDLDEDVRRKPEVADLEKQQRLQQAEKKEKADETADETADEEADQRKRGFGGNRQNRQDRPDDAPAVAAAPNPKPGANADAVDERVRVAAGGSDDSAAVDRAKSAPAKPVARPEAAGATVAAPAGPREVQSDRRRAVDGAVSKTRPAEPTADKASDKALLAWAQKQHDQVVSLVRSNNCRAAASAAVEIYSRAPGYYAANVTSDRQVKPCLAYLNSERDREERKVAAKRSAIEPPAAKPPATTESPAAEPPARAAPTRK